MPWFECLHSSWIWWWFAEICGLTIYVSPGQCQNNALIVQDDDCHRRKEIVLLPAISANSNQFQFPIQIWNFMQIFRRSFVLVGSHFLPLFPLSSVGKCKRILQNIPIHFYFIRRHSIFDTCKFSFHHLLQLCIF